MASGAKRKTLEGLAAAYIDFKQAALHIPEEKLSLPMHGEWSAKDVVAHIASWEELVSLDLRRLARGHAPIIAAFREADVDDWNAWLMRGRKPWPAAQVISELEGCYDMLVEAIECVPEALFEGGSLVTNILAICLGHYQQHARHIRDWRQKEGI